MSKVSLKLTHRPLDFDAGSAAFKPLALPDAARVALESLSGDALAHGQVRVSMELEAGLYLLPFSRGEPCRLEVPDGCRLDFEATAGPAPDGGGPMVTSLRGRFVTPVVFRNILSTLAEVRTLFRDHRSALAVSSEELAAWAGAALQSLAGRLDLGEAPRKLAVAAAAVAKAYGTRLDSVGAIHLSGFTASPARLRSGRPELRFRFDGDVVLFGRVSIPFRKVLLPRFILPSLHARLVDLAAKNPLASGDLLDERMPRSRLLHAIARMPSSFKATARAEGKLPDALVETQTFNRSTLSAEVGTLGTAQLQAAVSGVFSGGRVRVAGKGIQVTIGSSAVKLDLDAEAGVAELLDLATDSADDRSVEVSVAPPLSRPRATGGKVKVTVHEGARIGPVRAKVRVEHPVAKGATELGVLLEEARLSGTAELVLAEGARSISQGALELRFGGRARAEPGGQMDVGALRLFPDELAADLTGTARWSPGESLKVRLDARSQMKVRGEQSLAPIPELGFPYGKLEVELEGGAVVSGGFTVGGPEGRPGFDFEGSRVEASLVHCRARLDGLRLELPEGSTFSARATRGFINATGLGELEMALGWDLKGKSAVLARGERVSELFVEELRRMAVTARISPSGRLSFAGGNAGLYDGDFLNAVVNPLANQQKWLDILASETAMGRVLDAIEVLSPDLHKLAVKARALADRARSVAEREGIKKPADVIPRARMARGLSLLLAGDLRYQERLAAVIKRVTDAEGLDRKALEDIVSELWPDHAFTFELDRLLRWLDHVLSPAAPLPPPAVVDVLPLCERRENAPLLEGIPAAAEIYAALSAKGDLDPELAAKMVRLAPRLSLEQLGWILENEKGRLAAPLRSRLEYLRELKRRVDLIARGYGGIGYAPQAMAVAFFLADVLEADARYFQGIGKDPLRKGPGPSPADGVLGPEDVAVLLAAGLANVTPSRTAQLNQRMLFEYLLERPPLFTAGVLAELGLRSPRVLTNVLMNLLGQDQRHLREPLDLPATLARLLGTEIPRREDYMAGGRWAKESYYGALAQTAEFVLEAAEPYLALKQRLQQVRHPARPARHPVSAAALEKKAQAAIAEADALGAQCRFQGGAEGPVEQARAAYEEAFGACRKVLGKDRLAFQREWFKGFWFRNHEALVVRSVVRNYQEDVDRVRPWLQVRARRDAFQGEQELLEAVVDSLYFFPDDRKRLLADPLVRLLVDPPAGRYDFTVVSGMGVITEGERGRELEQSFRRLEERRGVRLVRADTGTMKPLEHNAARVIEAIEKVTTPFGLIGYSQGCANVVLAEALMRGGTPARQAQIEGLRCRNFLFSAMNGSAHGSCGNEKFVRAMVEGEQFLKYFQAIFSSSVIEGSHQAINAALSSPFSSILLGSVDSLSHEGVVALARDGQFLDGVPSSTVRGAITEEIVPEALEMLSNVITRQVRGALHDTQVTLVSAVGHPNRVRNRHVEVLERCDMGSYAQACHHWSPLLHETEFITTERDLARSIYDFPKDRHVFPWVEVNARFGTIEMAKARAEEPEGEPEGPKAPPGKRKATRKRSAA